MRHLCFLLALAVAACSSGTQPMQAMPSSNGAAQLFAPSVACPVVGRKYASGKASTTFMAKSALPGYALSLAWTVVFTKLPSSKPPLTYVPRIGKCGPASSKPLFGTVAPTSGGGTRSTCINGVCTVAVTYIANYTPRKKLPGNKDWRFVLIRFVPKTRKPPYGPLPAFRIAVLAL